MALLKLPSPYGQIDELLEHGDFAGARQKLEETRGNPALAEIVQVKLGLLDGSLAPQLAMNRLLVLMQKDANVPGAHDLYRQASERAYEAGRSSLAHSHPPPPMKPKG
jgi:hypothetical protein